jgi:hypothetical protein
MRNGMVGGAHRDVLGVRMRIMATQATAAIWGCMPQQFRRWLLPERESRSSAGRVLDMSKRYSGINSRILGIAAHRPGGKEEETAEDEELQHFSCFADTIHSSVHEHQGSRRQ